MHSRLFKMEEFGFFSVTQQALDIFVLVIGRERKRKGRNARTLKVLYVGFSWSLWLPFPSFSQCALERTVAARCLECTSKIDIHTHLLFKQVTTTIFQNSGSRTC